MLRLKNASRKNTESPNGIVYTTTTYLPTYLMTKRSGLSGNFFDVVIKDFFARA